jgi:hypothetical protein
MDLIMIEYKEIIDRVTNKLGINELSLSKRLNISQATLSERKKKNASTYGDVINLCLEEKIDMNLLFQENYEYIQGISFQSKLDENKSYSILCSFNSFHIPTEYFNTFTNDKNNTMAPNIMKYDCIIYKPIEEKSIYHKIYKVNDGDTILYKLDGLDVDTIHCRIVYKLSNNRLILKSYNENVPSYEVNYNIENKEIDIDIIGVVSHIIKNRV